jgi:hypothetical protein
MRMSMKKGCSGAPISNLISVATGGVEMVLGSHGGLLVARMVVAKCPCVITENFLANQAQRGLASSGRPRGKLTLQTGQ